MFNECRFLSEVVLESTSPYLSKGSTFSHLASLVLKAKRNVERLVLERLKKAGL